MQQEPSFAERDVRIARLGEVALRMLAGLVSTETLQAARHAAAEHPEHYPWEQVAAIVLAQPLDPSELVNKGLLAQRDWLRHGGLAAPAEAPRERPVKVVPPPAAAAPVAPAARAVAVPAPGGSGPRGRPRPRSFSYHVKKLVAVLLVRGTFYLVMLAAVLAMLVMLRMKNPELDIYRIGEAIRGWFTGLFGR
ncbi:MAG: hypothetical protein IPM29_19780 [Planctomycetes bacterium]|nr:hypothetical protein [Planctomycetota bacterium]